MAAPLDPTDRAATRQAEEIVSGFGGRSVRWATDAAERGVIVRTLPAER
ncbi:MAG TPA: hypothetical protein VND19_14740 [Acetobacteraceae bacterium]|nr:hypothetical protein [Acetobacteraceae bacterium]